MAKKTGEPSWKWRRSIIMGVILFALWTIHDMKDAADTMVNRAIVDGAVFALMAFGLGYTGLATVQDMTAIWRTRSGRPYREEPVCLPEQEPMP